MVPHHQIKGNIMTIFITAFFYGLGATMGFVSACAIAFLIFFIVSLILQD